MSARVDAEAKIVELPRAAGVVLALTPSTNPIATVYFKVLLALMTRNAVVVSPHPLAREVSADAAHHLARAAVEAGAPDGCVQVVEEPTIPLIEALMSDPTTDVILATGGVRGGAGGLPLRQPRHRRRPRQRPRSGRPHGRRRRWPPSGWSTPRASTTRSCAPTSRARSSRSAAPTRSSASCAATGGTCSAPDDVAAVREKLYPDGRIRLDLIGRDAQTLADEAGIRVPPKTRVLVAPFPLVVPEEPLAREKLFPRARARAGAGCAPRASMPPARCCASAAPATRR